MKQITLIILILALTCLVFTDRVEAQSRSLSIHPPIIEVQTIPPSSPLAPIVIQNNSEEDVSLKIELIPIKQSDTSGAISLIPELIDEGFYGYYRDRIQFLLDGKKTSSISLSPFESKQIEININLAVGDPPGDFYYSIVFISDSITPEDSSFSGLPAGIATNLLLSIGPKSPSIGGISEFTTSTFKNSGPVEFSLKVHNASKHLVEPTGVVDIYNLIGQKVGSVKLLPQYILAGADRHLLDEAYASSTAKLTYNNPGTDPTVIWPEKFLLGWYSAEAKIRLDENSEPLKSKTYFIAFPLYLFFPLVILIFVGISIYLKVKKKI